MARICQVWTKTKGHPVFAGNSICKRRLGGDGRLARICALRLIFKVTRPETALFVRAARERAPHRLGVDHHSKGKPALAQVWMSRDSHLDKVPRL